MSETVTKRRPAKTACGECGAEGEPAEYHPYVFCVLKKAGRDPWDETRRLVKDLLGTDLPKKPPLVRDLPLRRS
jgi:hypothetical protein